MVPLRRRADPRPQPAPSGPPAGTAKERQREVLWIPDIQSDEEKDVPLGDLFGRAENGDGRSPARRRSGGT